VNLRSCGIFSTTDTGVIRQHRCSNCYWLHIQQTDTTITREYGVSGSCILNL